MKCPNCKKEMYKAPGNSNWCSNCNLNIKDKKVRDRERR